MNVLHDATLTRKFDHAMCLRSTMGIFLEDMLSHDWLANVVSEVRGSTSLDTRQLSSPGLPHEHDQLLETGLYHLLQHCWSCYRQEAERFFR